MVINYKKVIIIVKCLAFINSIQVEVFILIIVLDSVV